MSSRKSLQLFYDVISPYSWLAFEVLCRYRQHWPMDLVLRPTFLGGVMNLSGNQPPGFLPARGKHMIKDIRRSAEFMNVPLRPSQFTSEYIMTRGSASLAAQRLLTAANEDCPQFVESLSREFWVRLWSKGMEIHSPEALMEVASHVGMTPDVAASLLDRSTSDEIKKKLKETTQEILDLGAYGLPCTALELPGFENTQIFFGSDRFEQMAYLLGWPWKGPQPDKSKL